MSAPARPPPVDTSWCDEEDTSTTASRDANCAYHRLGACLRNARTRLWERLCAGTGNLSVSFCACSYVFFLHVFAIIWFGAQQNLNGIDVESYTLSLYEAMLLMAGDHVEPQNHVERINAIIVFSVGQVASGLIVGAIIVKMHKWCHPHTEHAAQMRQVNQFLSRVQDLDEETKARIRECFDYQMRKYGVSDINRERRDVLKKMNKLQHRDVLIAWHAKLLDRCWMFHLLRRDGSGLSWDFVREILLRLTFQLYRQGDDIAQEGDACKDLFFIENGTVDVYLDDPDDEGSWSVNRLEDGDCFGELATFLNTTRTAWVRVNSKVLETWVLSVSDFKSIALYYSDDFEKVKKHVENTSLKFKGAPSEGEMTQQRALLEGVSSGWNSRDLYELLKNDAAEGAPQGRQQWLEASYGGRAKKKKNRRPTDVAGDIITRTPTTEELLSPRTRQDVLNPAYSPSVPGFPSSRSRFHSLPDASRLANLDRRAAADGKTADDRKSSLPEEQLATAVNALEKNLVGAGASRGADARSAAPAVAVELCTCEGSPSPERGRL